MNQSCLVGQTREQLLHSCCWRRRRQAAGGWAHRIPCLDVHLTCTAPPLQYIHEHKTAALLEAAVVSGAILGGASPVRGGGAAGRGGPSGREYTRGS